MKTKKLLDSFAIMAMLKAEDHYDIVVDTLKQARAGEVDVVMSQVNLGEIYYQIVKRQLTADPEKFLETFLTLPITILGNDLTLTLQAAKIKAQYALSYADCFAIATAIAEQATILTGNPAFTQVEHLVHVEWLE